MNKGKRSDTLPFISLTRKLERNVAVLFAGQLVNFVFQHLKGPNKLLARLRRQNHVISSAIRFAGDDGDARYRSLAEGIEQLGAVSDDAAPLLVGARQEAGHVFQHQQRNVE